MLENIIKWSKRLNIPLAGLEAIDAVTIIGNGVRDAITYLILCHRLNGRYVVGVTSALRVNLSIETMISIVMGERVNKFIIALDQEEFELDNLWSLVENKLGEYGIEWSLVKVGDRFRLYKCVHGVRDFYVIPVINGLSRRSYSKHVIEDHLLEVVKSVRDRDLLNYLSSFIDRIADPKELWNRLVQSYSDADQRIYRYMLDMDYRELRHLFLQQTSALELITEI